MYYLINLILFIFFKAVNTEHSCDSREAAYDDRVDALDRREAALNSREGSLESCEADYDDRVDALDHREAALNSREGSLESCEADYDDRVDALDHREAALNSREGSLESREGTESDISARAANLNQLTFEVARLWQKYVTARQDLIKAQQHGSLALFNATQRSHEVLRVDKADLPRVSTDKVIGKGLYGKVYFSR